MCEHDRERWTSVCGWVGTATASVTCLLDELWIYFMSLLSEDIHFHFNAILNVDFCVRPFLSFVAPAFVLIDQQLVKQTQANSFP